MDIATSVCESWEPGIWDAVIDQPTKPRAPTLKTPRACGSALDLMVYSVSSNEQYIMVRDCGKATPAASHEHQRAKLNRQNLHNLLSFQDVVWSVLL